MAKYKAKKVKSNQYVSFNKFSLVKHKKYKNTFGKEKGLDIVDDEKGKQYLVDADGTILTKDLKWFDEVGEAEVNKLPY
jgi:hypothetical protein